MRCPFMQPTRLDIGCGARCADGFTPWDIKDGNDARSLSGIADASLDAIRAIHVLEHIPYEETAIVLREWGRALKFGGDLYVAVPDFDKIIDAYKASHPDTERVLLGGHVDEHDRHLAIFNREKLAELFSLSGFDLVGEFPPAADTSAHWVSLNLHARKTGRRRLPVVQMPDVVAVMSVPRVGWTDTYRCLLDSFFALRISCIQTSGVFWGQCMTRSMEQVIKQGKAKWILAVDYDSVFDAHDLIVLRTIAEEYELDALAPLQSKRESDQILTKLDDGTGKPILDLDIERLNDAHLPCLHSHFGATLIRVDALKRLPKPWFSATPGETGEWDDGRTDEDIHFWKQATAAGWKSSITPRVRIGHLEILVAWSGDRLETIHQRMSDFNAKGRPQCAMPRI